MIIIAGLGNPGKEYLYTRHNLGHLAIDTLVNLWQTDLRLNKKLQCKIGKTMVFKKKVLLVKPLVFVNLSGEVIDKLVSKFGLSLSDILVICDDFSLPFGKIRLRMKGSSGGHKGLQSIITVFESNEFPRLRLGIGPVPARINPKEFVLSEFDSEEKLLVKNMLDESAAIVQKFIKETDG